jgi:hypothetical protein
MLIITLVFEKNANFFAENCQKSQKNVIITSTPDLDPAEAVAVIALAKPILPDTSQNIRTLFTSGTDVRSLRTFSPKNWGKIACFPSNYC